MKFTIAASILLAVSAPNAAQHTAPPLKTLAAKKGIYVGVAVGNGYLNDANYTAIMQREFNMFTPENSMKWEVTEPQPAEFQFADGDVIVATAAAQGAAVRGHTLETLTAAIQRHIKGVAGHYNNLAHWDVVNEVIGDNCNPRDSVFLRTFGNLDDFVEIAFRTARQYAPNTKLYINDYNMEGEYACKPEAMYALIKRLKAKGVPIDGLGAQAHMLVGQIPTNIIAQLQNFTSLDIDVALTELDIRATQPFTADVLAQQSRDYETVFRACLAVKRCQGITLWGISDKYSWIPGVFSDQGAALPWDENYNTKPAYDGIVRALTTDATTGDVTGNNGNGKGAGNANKN
ncbi:hypothetical protein HDV00_009003 [Rhizophlyctis rosea]|nr:hypothetical protein HDV00_009003 [Rhizophlyctis rosea]